MKYKYNFIFQRVGAVVLGIAVGKDSKKYSKILKFNETSYDVAKHLVEEHTVDELVDLFLDEYDITPDEASSVVGSVVQYLSESQVLNFES